MYKYVLTLTQNESYTLPYPILKVCLGNTSPNSTFYNRFAFNAIAWRWHFIQIQTSTILQKNLSVENHGVTVDTYTRHTKPVVTERVFTMLYIRFKSMSFREKRI